MKKKIFHNWSLKLASLILAFILWALVAKIGNPPHTVTFYNVPVKLVNTDLLEKQNKVYEVLEKTDTVRVTIKAPRSVTAELSSRDIIAEADIAKLTDINTIEIVYNVPSVIESIKGDHDVVKLSVEERMTKWIRVQSQTVGEVAEDYIVAGATLDQNRIEVSGPKSMVEQINYAGIEVDVDGASANISLNMEPQFYNQNGELLDVSGSVKSTSYIHVEVEVLLTKEVPVELNVMGIPAEGYVVTGEIESSVETVKIAGKASTLAMVNKIVVPKEQLNITGATGDMENLINLKEFLPENVRFADSGFNGKITATVHVEQLVERQLNLTKTNFAFINLPEGYTATMAETVDTYELVIGGLKTDLDEVRADSVRGEVNVGTWMSDKELKEIKPGIYEIPAKFTMPEGITVKNDVVVKVTISKIDEL